MAAASRRFSTVSFPAILVLCHVLLGLLPRPADSTNVGVCYGMIADNLPPPSEVVELYKANGIRRMRLFFPTPDVLAALRGSGIEVILDVPREHLWELASNQNAAAGWVRDNVLAFYPDIRFRYIGVGNEVIPGDYAGAVLPAMRNVQTALSSARVEGQIKVSTVVHMGALDKTYPPSAGVFTEKAGRYMQDIASFLQSTGSPLLANVYPYLSYADNPGVISPEYALFTSPRDVVTDGNLRYQNLFDAMLDSVYAALEKVGAGGVEVVVSESGWPSAGGTGASVDNAGTYNNNLVRHVGGGAGTPRRPGKEVEAYIFAMFNENKKTGAGVENNFGLFFPDKRPVYPIQF